MRLATLPGVFRPRSDAWLLVEVMRQRRLATGRSVLDLFTGSGVVAVAAALAGAGRVSAIDVSRRAVLCARLNGWLNGVRLGVLRGDLLDPVAGERFGLITANPPYVPGLEGIPARGSSRAWEGGPDGRILLDRFCDALPGALEPDGCALIVQSSLADPAATVDRLADAGLEASVAVRRRGPLGPLIAARADALEAAGILAPGQRHEELVVIAAAPE